MGYGKQGTQGPMWQNTAKGDGVGKERAAHEACDGHDYGGKPMSTPAPKHGKGSDLKTEREGGY